MFYIMYYFSSDAVAWFCLSFFILFSLDHLSTSSTFLLLSGHYLGGSDEMQYLHLCICFKGGSLMLWLVVVICNLVLLSVSVLGMFVPSIVSNGIKVSIFFHTVQHVSLRPLCSNLLCPY